MYSVYVGSSKYSDVDSSKTEGARGRHHSLPFISLTIFRVVGFVGSATMLLFPKALGPNSALPWYHATIPPLATSSATSAESVPRYCDSHFPLLTIPSISSAEYSGPR